MVLVDVVLCVGSTAMVRPSRGCDTCEVEAEEEEEDVDASEKVSSSGSMPLPWNYGMIGCGKNYVQSDGFYF